MSLQLVCCSSAYDLDMMAPNLGDTLTTLLVALSLTQVNGAEHHMKRDVSKRQDGNTIQMVVTNKCSETIHPAILTQAGPPVSESG